MLKCILIKPFGFLFVCVRVCGMCVSSAGACRQTAECRCVSKASGLNSRAGNEPSLSIFSPTCHSFLHLSFGCWQVDFLAKYLECGLILDAAGGFAQERHIALEFMMC